MSKAKISTEFIELIGCLKAMYNSGEIQHILLTEGIGQRDTLVKINKLAELAREAFLAVHTGKDGFNPNEPRFSVESFCKIALHAIASLQRKLVILFQKGANKNAYMLLVSDDNVYWQEWTKDIEEFLRKK